MVIYRNFEFSFSMSLPVNIVEVLTKKDLKRFVTFPCSLYGSNPYWIPPLISEEMENFDPQKNPVYGHAVSRLFLAEQGGKTVGRIAALVNFTEVDKQGIKKMRFGWFDVIDDVAITKALLDKVTEIGKEYQLDFIEGPVGFSNMDKVGVLTYGFEEKGDMISWYNAPYYAAHFEKLGFETANEWHEHYFDIHFQQERTQQYAKMADVVKRRYQLRSVTFQKTEEVLPYVDKIFDLFDKTYSKLVTYVPLSQREIQYFKDKYVRLIDPEFVKFVEDQSGNPVAFAITMRSFADALKKANGHLFPFGFIHLLRAKKQSKEVLFYLIGIHPDYQKKGVVAIIFDEFAKSYTKHGITRAYRTPELVTNTDINALWKEFNPINHRKRKTFRKGIR